MLKAKKNTKQSKKTIQTKHTNNQNLFPGSSLPIKLTACFSYCSVPLLITSFNKVTYNTLLLFIKFIFIKFNLQHHFHVYHHHFHQSQQQTPATLFIFTSIAFIKVIVINIKFLITSFNNVICSTLGRCEQARKSSEDAQATGYAQVEKVWAG